MPYNLLLLPLLGGFLFFYSAHLLRFQAQRLEGYKLLFQSAIAGVLLSFAARLIVFGLSVTAYGPWLGARWSAFSPFPFSGTSALSMILGPIAALILNLFIGRDKARDIEVRRNGNPLIQLLYRAAEEHLLLSVTMDSRKWYVGWVVESPALMAQEKYFRLLPYMSGYRDGGTLETFRTTFYEDALATPGLDADELVLTLPIDGVRIAGRFNEKFYNEYFAEQEPDEAATGETPTA
jgi:hypothetical protein